MSSDDLIISKLVIVEDLNTNTQDCFSFAGWNLADKGEDKMSVFNNGTDVFVKRNTDRIDSAARIGWVGMVIGHRGKDAIIEFEDGCIGYIAECDLESL